MRDKVGIHLQERVHPAAFAPNAALFVLLTAQTLYYYWLASSAKKGLICRDSFSIRRSLWREGSSTSLKIDESRISPLHEFDDDVASSRGSRESTRFGMNESKEVEIRRVGRPRGATRTERFSPQQMPQKSNYGEKRKQRSVPAQLFFLNQCSGKSQQQFLMSTNSNEILEQLLIFRNCKA